MVDEYIQQIKERYPLEKVRALLDSLRSKKVLVIGDTIIDEYCFVHPKGRATKDPMLSVGYSHEEKYAGGILAIANHLSSFVNTLTCVTLLGENADQEEFVRQGLRQNVALRFFVKPHAPTIRKRRYVSELRHEKMFKVEYMDDQPIDAALEQEIIRFLEQELPKYDLVVVGDFGHGFIDTGIVKVLEEKSNFLAVNVQTNSANFGFNFATKYGRPSFITMDGMELEYAVGDRDSPYPVLMQKLYQLKGYPHFLVTLGKEGASYVEQGVLTSGQALASKITDVVGAGDAVFAITSLLVHQGVDRELIPFLGNAVGAVKVSIMGNKESVTKEKLLEFVAGKYKEAEEQDIHSYFSTVSSALNNLDKGGVNGFVAMLLEAYHGGRTIYVFGNGGSAATASHFCGDLVKGVSYGLEKRFKAICLNDNLPTLMAIANDLSYDDIFVEQLKNFLSPGDLVIGISGSGNSRNIVKALEYARQGGGKTVAICGYKGGKIKEIADLSLHAEVDDMEISEDIHNLVITHCVKRLLTNELNNSHNVGEEYAKRVR